jgi:hypothetical protein
MDITIYLRTVIKDKSHCLAMYDSKRKGDINNLETVVEPGAKIVWTLDADSGIKRIINIHSREKESKIFKGDLTEKSPEGFTLEISKDSARILEAYIIEYIVEEKIGERMVEKKVVIDPYIRIEPPPL